MQDGCDLQPMMRDHGAAITLFQLFRDFEVRPERQRRVPSTGPS